MKKSVFFAITMKYLVRSVKYFFYLAFILVLVVFALVQFKIVDADLSTMFVNGYDSYWQIALMLAVFSSLYPKWGFSTRKAYINGSFEELKDGIVEVMENHGYVLENSEGEDMTFRKRSGLSKALKVWEDRITFSREIAGYRLEGLTRDLPRLVAALENKFSPDE